MQIFSNYDIYMTLGRSGRLLGRHLRISVVVDIIAPLCILILVLILMIVATSTLTLSSLQAKSLTSDNTDLLLYVSECHLELGVCLRYRRKCCGQVLNPGAEFVGWIRRSLLHPLSKLSRDRLAVDGAGFPKRAARLANLLLLSRVRPLTQRSLLLARVTHSGVVLLLPLHLRCLSASQRQVCEGILDIRPLGRWESGSVVYKVRQSKFRYS